MGKESYANVDEIIGSWTRRLMNHLRAGHLVLCDWAPDEDHNTLPLIFILPVL